MFLLVIYRQSHLFIPTYLFRNWAREDIVVIKRLLSSLQVMSTGHLDSPVSSGIQHGFDDSRIVESKLGDYIRHFTSQQNHLTLEPDRVRETPSNDAYAFYNDASARTMDNFEKSGWGDLVRMDVNRLAIPVEEKLARLTLSKS